MFSIARILAGLSIVGLLGILTFGGTGEYVLDDVPQPALVAVRLTVPEARQALISLVENQPQEEQAYFQLAELRTGGGIVLLDEQTERYYTTESWNCHLQEKTFRHSGPLRLHGCHREDMGVFEQIGGRWHARFVGTSWGCSK